MPRPAIERPEEIRLNHIRLPQRLIDEVDRWAEANMAASRQEALRRLLQMALEVDRVSWGLGVVGEAEVRLECLRLAREAGGDDVEVIGRAGRYAEFVMPAGLLGVGGGLASGILAEIEAERCRRERGIFADALAEIADMGGCEGVTDAEFVRRVLEIGQAAMAKVRGGR